LREISSRAQSIQSNVKPEERKEKSMLLYSFNADFREVLRRLATAAQNDDSQNKSFDEKGSVHTLDRRAAMEPQQQRRAS
jgi:hypothetical protein